jgi:hypothetical protein
VACRWVCRQGGSAYARSVQLEAPARLEFLEGAGVRMEGAPPLQPSPTAGSGTVTIEYCRGNGTPRRSLRTVTAGKRLCPDSQAVILPYHFNLT